MAEMQYSEFRQKLTKLVHEVVTQLPESRPVAQRLAILLGNQARNGEPSKLLYTFRAGAFRNASKSSAAQGLKEQIENLAMDADYALSYGCTQKEFEQWKYNRDLTKAIEEAIGEEI